MAPEKVALVTNVVNLPSQPYPADQKQQTDRHRPAVPEVVRRQRKNLIRYKIRQGNPEGKDG